MPLVSVIIPVYNVEEYLRQCLDSVREQTLSDIEIICVNDSSTDGSLSILEEYAKKDPRIQVVTQPNGGAGAARNKGLSMAAGKYLSFLDSDDFFEPDMLELAYKKAEEDKADFVVFDVTPLTGTATFKLCSRLNACFVPVTVTVFVSVDKL